MKQNICQGIIAPLFCLLMIFTTLSAPISAQEGGKEKKWNFLTDVYLMFPIMDGEIGIGNNLTVPIDANPGDIFSKLKIAAMLYLEASTGKWAIASDLVYMNLNQEVTPGIILHSGTATAKQLVWEVSGLYRVFPFLEVGAGGRLNNLNTAIDVRRNVFPAGTEEVTGSGSATWFDPVLITRFSTDIKDKWLFQFRGDIGGFGLGSDLTWQLQAYAGYRFTNLFQLTAGYRILSTDYHKGADSNQFIFNVNEFGPVIRFGFNF
ncbi:MAG: hypothetical protein E4G95_03110 [Bacteroidia bacterium]|nr:MAG: hypothetical protein E4G95_03110 [Bacteroidia bacterium]